MVDVEVLLIVCDGQVSLLILSPNLFLVLIKYILISSNRRN